MSHSHHHWSSTPPGLIKTIRVLLWSQVGFGAVQCWFDPLIVYVTLTGVHPGDPQSATDVVGVTAFGLMLLATAAPLAVIAVRIASGGPGTRVWALVLLTLPLAMLVVYVVAGLFVPDLAAIGSLGVVTVLAVLHAPVPVAAIACLFTPAARAWFHRKPEPSM